ncbi:type III-A CRISPR-associated protein Cas10/Csm1 [Clostridiaceae bacterium UIB06]|uniref:CRISPR system single-strand-specific deoxyribonuclease Cas10/Csm1 (subtype III-A) n=1 Tax=Clostridium thailandense TaxID=2794346 RepID=A0A949TLL5_9CLOT|nr:type III-A CRISPR-associated protein Cas10/Csm1 [Clostridium thailandense]MBV7275124.1 type III-A CRISPR-associated protein Cas10/Csm1 [Clostridium thailandense]MCH5136919.1 type III-A CRISPR-associated protein Cas10/Csm1 [Clostridiaceae bacterium UIB06]
MECNNLIYAFAKYLKNIDKQRYNKLLNIFSINNNDNVEKAYSAAIGNQKIEMGKNSIYKLRNILSNSDNSYFSFRELKLDFDSLKKSKKEDNTIERCVWNNYIDDVLNKLESSKDNFKKVYYICMKYLSNIPAVNKENCDISLFDICKITSAIVKCQEKNHNEFLLIKGDFSGIQNFIYKTKKADALKTLKAHSLYLTLLQDLCSKYIVRKLDLNITNILYSGGGNFYIIASKENIEAFKKIREELSKILLNAHNGELYLALAEVEFTLNDFNSFEEVWKKVGDSVGKIKNKKWNEVGLKENFKKIFGPIDDGGRLNQTCSICNCISEKLDEEKRCPLCQSYIELIEGARNKKYYIEEEIEFDLIKDTYDKVTDIFKSLGYNIFFTEDFYRVNEKTTIYSINDFGNDAVDGYIFKSVKLSTNSLDEMVASSQLLGDNKIGVIKLDVDNLGSLFINTKSIGQVIGLSRNISTFFEGFVEKTIENNYIPEKCRQYLKTKNWKEKITIIYAGGDDTFVVGRYEEVFEFAYVLREVFRTFVDCKDKTFSAGVGMFNSDFPILKTAEITEDFLCRGKLTEGKDKICFLGEIFTWEQYLELIKLKNLIEKIYGKTKSKSIFEKIDKSTKGFKAVFKKGDKNVNYIKMYRLAYYLRDLKTDENIEMIESLVEQYENICLSAITKSDLSKQAMIIPFANKWAQCNCRHITGGDKIV